MRQFSVDADVRSLVLWQPWAWFCWQNHKHWETRPGGISWRNYRGWVAIQSAATEPAGTWETFSLWNGRFAYESLIQPILPADFCFTDLPRGVIGSIAYINKICPMVESATHYGWLDQKSGLIVQNPIAKSPNELRDRSGAEALDGYAIVPVVQQGVHWVEAAPIDQQTRLELALGDWQTGRLAIHMENQIPLSQPVPWAGGQGIRRLPVEVKQAIAAQLPSAVTAQ